MGKLPDNRIITATYDDNGNLTSITPPGRPAHEFLYTPMNQESVYDPPSPEPTPQPAIADPATYYTYNDDRQMETITRPDGGVITFLYDDSPANTGQLLHQVLPTGQGQIDYAYYPSTAGSGAGLPQSITAPDGGVLSFTYGGSLLFQEAFEVLQATELGRQTLVESTRFPDESLEQVVTLSDGAQSNVETAADQSCLGQIERTCGRTSNVDLCAFASCERTSVDRLQRNSLAKALRRKEVV